jgi:predicted TPR repeat methyltransferase
VSERLDRDYFEELYATSKDPWNFETSDYEREKYARTLAALGDRRFRHALEAGASIGVFTQMLAGRCDRLLAVDVSEKAVTAARERLKGRGHVTVERRTLPEEMPEGPFDLIVASEVLYYFTREEMLAMLNGFEAILAPGGVLLAVHWRRETRTYPLQGDEVHELLAGHTRLALTRSVAEPDYRLDLFEDLG